MGKTILRRAVGEVVELIKDTGKEAGKQTKEIFKGAAASILGDLPKPTNAEFEQLKKKEEGRGPEIVAIRKMLAGESQAKQQLAQEAQARHQAPKPHQRVIEQAVLPTSGKKQFGISGLGHKKATTFIAPVKQKSPPSSVETKYAGRD